MAQKAEKEKPMEANNEEEEEKEVAELVASETSSHSDDNETAKPNEHSKPFSDKQNLLDPPPLLTNVASYDEHFDETMKNEFSNNHKWILKSRPVNKFSSDDLDFVLDPLDVSKVKENKVVVRVDVLAIDPFIRTMMNEDQEEGASCLQINDSIQCMGVGTVVKESEMFSKGQVVVGIMSAAQYTVVDNGLLQEKIAFAKPSAVLGILGQIGEAAYLGTHAISHKKPSRDDIVLVNDAASPIGILVCQICKHQGCKVYGITNSEEKRKFLENLEMDGVILIDSSCSECENDLDHALRQFCQDGLDFVFDTVGNVQLDQILNHINTKCCIVCCDVSSSLDGNDNKYALKNYEKLIERSACLYGFNTTDYPDKSFKAAAYLAWHYMRDSFVFPQKTKIGIEAFSEALEIMLEDKTVGRLLVQVSDQFENVDRQKQGATGKKVEDTVCSEGDENEGETIDSLKLAKENAEKAILKAQILALENKLKEMQEGKETPCSGDKTEEESARKLKTDDTQTVKASDRKTDEAGEILAGNDLEKDQIAVESKTIEVRASKESETSKQEIEN